MKNCQRLKLQTEHECVCGFDGKSGLSLRRHQSTCEALRTAEIPEPGDPRKFADAARKVIAEGRDDSVCLACDTIIKYFDPSAQVVGMKIEGQPGPGWENVLRPSLDEPDAVREYYTAGFVGLTSGSGSDWSKLLLSPSRHAYEVGAGGEVTAFMCTTCAGALKKKAPTAPKFAIASGFAMGTLEHAQSTAGFPKEVTEQEFALAQRIVPRLQFRLW